MRGDLPGRQTLRRERDHQLVDALQPALALQPAASGLYSLVSDQSRQITGHPHPTATSAGRSLDPERPGPPVRIAFGCLVECRTELPSCETERRPAGVSSARRPRRLPRPITGEARRRRQPDRVTARRLARLGSLPQAWRLTRAPVRSRRRRAQQGDVGRSHQGERRLRRHRFGLAHRDDRGSQPVELPNG